MELFPAPPHVGVDNPVLLGGCKESSKSPAAGQDRPDYPAPLCLGGRALLFSFKDHTLTWFMPAVYQLYKHIPAFGYGAQNPL